MNRTSALSLCMLISACSQPQSKQASGPSPLVDTAQSSDTAPSDDSGLTASVEVTVRLQPTPCGAPEERETLGHFIRWESEAWADQPFVPWMPDELPINAGWGLSVHDFNEDGMLDIFLPGEPKSSLWLGTTQGGWVDAGPLPNYPRAPIGSLGADLDNDGDPDLVVVGAEQRIWRNDGGTFTEVKKGDVDGALDGQLIFSAAAADINADGNLDLLAPVMGDISGIDTDEDIPQGDLSRVLIGHGDMGFTDVTHQVFQDGGNDGYPFQGTLFDVDNDQHTDIYIVNDMGRLADMGNHLWRNTGNLQFTDVTIQTGTGIKLDAMGLAIGDINEDSLPDFAISGTEELRLLESSVDGTWVQTDLSRGLSPDVAGQQEVAWGLDFGDIDNDGDLDLWVGFGHKLNDSQEQPDALYINQDGSFEDQARREGLADTTLGRAGLLVDLNQDGWLDLVRRPLHKPATIDLARCGESGWLIVRPRQPTRNRLAIGARVEVRNEGKTWTRWVMAGGQSIASSGPAEIHVGLGALNEVDNVRIIWPDGGISDLGPVASRQVVTVTRIEENL